MAASTAFANRVILVIYPVCAWSGQIIKSRKIKADMLSAEGTLLKGVRLVIKDSGYLVFCSAEPLKPQNIRIQLEVPGYLSGSCRFELNASGKSVPERRILLYPDRSMFLGEKYTALCGSAPYGSRVLAWSADQDRTYRLMGDVPKGAEEISLFSDSGIAEGKTLAAADREGKILCLLEIDELVTYPNIYRLKRPADCEMKRLETNLYPASVTQPQTDGSYFLPVNTSSVLPVKYHVLLEKNVGEGQTAVQKSEIPEIEIIPGKENHLDLNWQEVSFK